MWTRVSSSNIAAVKSSGDDLIVMFHSGSQYIYFGAACELDNLENASSVGGYFNSVIKNSYEWKKI